MGSSLLAAVADGAAFAPGRRRRRGGAGAGKSG